MTIREIEMHASTWELTEGAKIENMEPWYCEVPRKSYSLAKLGCERVENTPV
jgi:hypothetical protein